MRKYSIASDLVQVKAIQPVVYKQFDNGDNLVVEFQQDGDKIAITTETVLAFFQLPEGTIIQKNCSIVDGNAIATLDNNILSLAGTVNVEFTIYDGENETTTRSILITVEQSINRNEAIQTIPKWDIVEQIIELKPNLEAAEIIRNANEEARKTEETKRINSEETRIENETTRKSQETARQTNTTAAITNANDKATFAQQQGDYAKAQGDYAKSQADIIAVASKQYDIYGVRWDKTSNPQLTRFGDSANFVANVGVNGQYVQNDFDKAAIYREIGPVVDSLGNVFIRIPKFYIRKKDGPGFKSWEISKIQYPGFYLPWCFWDFANQKELPYIDVGKYKATLGAGNKLESKPDLFPLISQNIVNFRTYAKNNNANGLKGYQQLDVHVYDMLQTLFYVEFATLNSQAIMQGWVSGQYTNTHTATVAESNTNRIIVSNATAALYAVGQPISIGTSQGGNQIFYGRSITSIDVYDANNKAISFDGAPVNIAVGNYLYNTGWINGFSRNIAASSGSINSNSDGKNPLSYRGIESLWGDIYQFVDGININNNQAWVTENADDYASNVFAAPYKQLGYINANANGYPTEMGYDEKLPYAAFPKTLGGGSTTYYSDYYYQAAGQLIARVGGYWVNGAIAGVSCWSLDTSSGYSSVGVGGRLLKKPL